MKNFIRTLAAALIAGAATLAHAADAFPSRPIKIVVAFPPGGGVDLVARILGAKLSDAVHQPVVVENRPGATGIIGSQFVANAPADGYTLLVGIAGTHSIPVAMHAKLPYDVLKDFTAVTRVGISPNFLIVNPSLPVKNLQELVALVKSKPPGTFSYGSWGNGSGGHFIGELLKSRAGIDMVHVPYRGGPALVNATISGELQIAVADGATVPPFALAGRVRAVGTAAPVRAPGLPDVPTFGEQGIPFQEATWFGVFGPGGMPAPVLTQLSTVLRKIIDSDETKEELKRIGVIAASTSPQEFSRILRDDIATWSKVADKAGIRGE